MNTDSKTYSLDFSPADLCLSVFICGSKNV